MKGGVNPKATGVPTYYLANFRRKVNENEDLWAKRGGVGVPQLHPQKPNGNVI